MGYTFIIVTYSYMYTLYILVSYLYFYIILGLLYLEGGISLNMLIDTPCFPVILVVGKIQQSVPYLPFVDMFVNWMF